MNIIQFEPPRGEEYPIIQVTDGDISRISDETQDVLLAQNKPVFVRGGQLVQPIYTEYPMGGGRVTRNTILRTFNIHSLRYMLNKRCIRYLKWDGRRRAMVPCDPPDKLLSTMISVGHWKLHPMFGVFNCPTISADGQIIYKRGYDQENKIWLDWHNSLALDENFINHVPSKSEAVDALQLIWDLLQEFPFVEAYDKSVAVAAMMTPVLHGAFGVTPMFLFLSHTSGSGKSYLADLVSGIASGRPCPVIAAMENEEETKKQLNGIILEGSPVVSLDNYTTDIDNPLICQMCSQEVLKVRALGGSIISDCVWRSTFLGTGNNIQFADDMLRRGLTCCIDPRMEYPENRRFAARPMETILADRARYITAILTIARAYKLGTHKMDVEPFVTFENWSDMVRAPLLWLGCDDVIKTVKKYKVTDIKRMAMRSFLYWWATKHVSMTGKPLPLTARTMTEMAREMDASEFENGPRLRNPELFDSLMELVNTRGNQLEVRSVGRWLTRSINQIQRLFFEESDNAKTGNYCIEIHKKDVHCGNSYILRFSE
jgi:putative DNA primase/helicase